MKTVLVGEDSQVERKLIELVLGAQPGIQATLYDNGLDLWRNVLTDPPDLVVVDVLLTGLDGVSFCRLMRGHRQFRHSPPILAISSMTTPGTEATLLEHGATRFLQKPFSPDALAITVTELLVGSPAR